MRTIVLTAVSAGLVAAAAAARAAPAEEAKGPATLTVCDNLVTLRRLMAQELAHRNPDDPGPEPDRTGCSMVAADQIGDLQRRTVIGGAPYECRSIGNGPCRWVQP